VALNLSKVGATGLSLTWLACLGACSEAW